MAKELVRTVAHGRAVVVKNAEEALKQDTEGAIIVTTGSDRDMMPAIEKCAGLITEESGLTSHAAVVGLKSWHPGDCRCRKRNYCHSRWERHYDGC